MENKKDTLTFEVALKRLEEIVHLLEEGNAPLTDSLSLFEEGITLVKLCNSQLDGAEQKVKLLIENPDGSVKTEDFRAEA
jgi:exodeoxyribonuclease VII small subunit